MEMSIFLSLAFTEILHLKNILGLCYLNNYTLHVAMIVFYLIK